MLRILRSRLTYANVVASLALFLALGGAAFAVKIAAKNSVTSTSIKNGQVKNPDLGPNAVTSTKIKNGTVATKDLNFNDVFSGLGLAFTFLGGPPVVGGAVGPVFVADPLEIDAGCFDDGAGNSHATLTIKSNDGPAWVTVENGAGVHAAQGASTPLAATTTAGTFKAQGVNFSAASLTPLSQTHALGQLNGRVVAISRDTEFINPPNVNCVFLVDGDGFSSGAFGEASSKRKHAYKAVKHRG